MYSVFWTGNAVKLGPISHYLLVILLLLGRSGAPLSENDKSAVAYTGRLYSISYPCVPKETRIYTMWLLVQIVHCLSWRLLASSTPCFFTYFFHTCLRLSHIPYMFHFYACFFLAYFNVTSFFILSSLSSLYCYFLIFLHSWSLSFLHYSSPWKFLSFLSFYSLFFRYSVFSSCF